MAKKYDQLHVTKLHTEIAHVGGVGAVRQITLTAVNLELLNALGDPNRIEGLWRRIANEAGRPDSDQLLRCMPVEVTLRGYVAAANASGEKLIQAAKDITEKHAGASLTEWQTYLQQIGFVEHGFNDHHSYAVSQLGGRAEARYLTNGKQTEGRVNAIGYWITGYAHSVESWRDILRQGEVQRIESQPRPGQPDPAVMAQQYMSEHYKLPESDRTGAKTTTALPGSLIEPRPPAHPDRTLMRIPPIAMSCGTRVDNLSIFAPSSLGMPTTAERLGLFVPTR